mgnify:CR=1 FL=1
MIGKIISCSSFAGTVGYVMKEQSRVLAAEGGEHQWALFSGNYRGYDRKQPVSGWHCE